MHFTARNPKPEKQIHGPLRRVLTDAPQGDTLKKFFLGYTNPNTGLSRF